MQRIRQPFIRLLIAVIGLFTVISLSRSVWRLWRKQDVVGERQVVLEREKAVNDRLKKELEEAKTPAFVEREAREKLGMVKEGETVVIMPNPPAGEAGDKLPMPNERAEEKTAEAISNWKKWWRLIN